MLKRETRLKRNILEYATNTIIQCSAMDPEPRKGSAKPAGHPKPETETNLQTGRRAQDPRRLHPEDLQPRQMLPEDAKTPLERENTRQA